MIERIKELETTALTLEPDRDTLDSWVSRVGDYAMDFIHSLESGRAYNDNDTSHELHTAPFAEHGKPLDELLQLLARSVDSPGINPASGGHLGYIPGGGLVPASFGDFLAAVTNRYAGIYFANPGAVRMENLLIRWMADLFGFPQSAHGNLASGGSIANLIAVTTARDAKGITPENVRSSVIYLHRQTHHCVDKALRIAGLGYCQVRLVDLDGGFRMDPAHLRQLIQEDQSAGLNPFMVVGSLGSTDTGAVDPLDQVAEVCEEFGLWFHVDAAYGGFFILVPELQPLFKGVERADSLVIDPHKGMFLPYGVGAVLVKDVDALNRSHSYTANYMQDATVPDEYSPADLSPELTKHYRGLRMWLPMQLFGIEPFRAALEEKWQLALYFREQIALHGFEVGPVPELSVVIYRANEDIVDVNAFNLELTKEMHSDGRIFISSTTIDGVVWLRFAALCFRTHLHHVDLLIEMLQTKRNALRERY